MRVLVTGVNGFVGRAVYDALSVEHQVFGTFRSGNALFENCFQADLRVEEAFLDSVKTFFPNGVDVIIHLAGRTAGAKSMSDLSIVSDNIAMARSVALAALANKSTHVINFSSTSVYPNTSGTCDENTNIDPSVNADCLYGISKFNSEVIITNLLRPANIPTTHLRVAMIYGLGMDQTRIMPVFERELKEYNRITVWGNGKRLINIIRIHKLVEYLSFFLANPQGGVFNVSEETISLIDLAKRICLNSGNSLSQIVTRPEGNDSQFRVDVRKLEAALKATGEK